MLLPKLTRLLLAAATGHATSCATAVFCCACGSPTEHDPNGLLGDRCAPSRHLWSSATNSTTLPLPGPRCETPDQSPGTSADQSPHPSGAQPYGTFPPWHNRMHPPRDPVPRLGPQRKDQSLSQGPPPWTTVVSWGPPWRSLTPRDPPPPPHHGAPRPAGEGAGAQLLRPGPTLGPRPRTPSPTP